MSCMLAYVAGLSFVPAPWIPEIGEEFECRLRGHYDRWFLMRWHGWSKVDPGQANVEPLELGPRSFDVIVEMRARSGR